MAAQYAVDYAHWPGVPMTKSSPMAGVAVVEYLARHPAPASVGEIQEKLGLSRPTLYRLLEDLREQGWVEVFEGAIRTYATGWRLEEMSYLGVAKNRNRQLVLPFLLGLASAAPHTAHLSHRRGATSAFTDTAEVAGDRMLLRASTLRIPLVLSAGGRAMLARSAADEVGRLTAPGFAGDGDRPPLSAEQLRIAVEEARSRGYAVGAVGRRDAWGGVVTVGAAVLDGVGLPVMALSLVVERHPLSPDEIHQLGDETANWAKMASRELGWQSGMSGATPAP